MRKTVWAGTALAVVLVLAVAVAAWRSGAGRPASAASETRGEVVRGAPEAPRPVGGGKATAASEETAVPRPSDGDEPSDGDPEAAEPQSEEEKLAAEEEKLVDAFDALTDKWQEPSSKGVTMADVDAFAKAFRRLPKARRDECIHRALNLVPDENVMLLVGVLMDKTMDREIVEEVYNDVLNRDEDVKGPILQEIFKDKSHPCWTDTAWILDVTDDLPKKK